MIEMMEVLLKVTVFISGVLLLMLALVLGAGLCLRYFDKDGK